MTDIKPCPFCGSDAHLDVVPGTTFRWRRVECGCGVYGPEARHNTITDDQAQATEDSYNAAIVEWNNQRGIAAAREAALEEAAKVCDDHYHNGWTPEELADTIRALKGKRDE